MKIKALISACAVLLPLVGLADPPPNPPLMCLGSECEQQRSPASSEGVKWHPGHYAYIHYGFDHRDEEIRRKVLAFIDSLADEKNVEGILVSINWVSLERSFGDYSVGFEILDEYLERLERYGKRLMVRFYATHYNGSGSNWADYFPAYLVQPERGGTDRDGVYGITEFDMWCCGLASRAWQRATMDRIIALNKAYGERYNDHPLFELWGFTGETAKPIVAGTDGYSVVGYANELKRAITEMRRAWPNTNIRIQSNFLGGDANAIDLMKHFADDEVYNGQSQPDQIPHEPSQFDKVFVGAIGGTSYKGRIPYFAEIQPPELCDGKDSKPGASAAANYTARDFHDYLMNRGHPGLDGTPLEPSHVIWYVHDGWMCDVPSQTWAGAGGHLDFIRTAPPVNTACPSLYPTCNRD